VIALAAGAFAVGVATGGAGSEGTRTPRLQVASAAPLTLRGTGFVAGERVRVTVAAAATRTKRVVAGRSGRFLVGFTGVSYDRCLGMGAQAVGAEGSLARLKLPQPLCPPN
jgi:hypothetical protein